MTTVVLEPRTDVKTQTGSGSGYQQCDGCPRCQDPNSGFCTTPHPKFQNRHPVCKACGHCVLRGKHIDDASDLDDHPGLGPEFSRHGISRN